MTFQREVLILRIRGENKRVILLALKGGVVMTSREISEQVGISRKMVCHVLKNLAKEKMVSRCVDMRDVRQLLYRKINPEETEE